jgi:hypothetical protein
MDAVAVVKYFEDSVCDVFNSPAISCELSLLSFHSGNYVNIIDRCSCRRCMVCIHMCHRCLILCLTKPPLLSSTCSSVWMTSPRITERTSSTVVGTEGACLSAHHRRYIPLPFDHN